MIGFRNRTSPPRAALFAGVGGIIGVFGACMAEPAGISSDDDESGGKGGHTATGGHATGGTEQPGGAGSDQGGTSGTGATGNGGEDSGTGGSTNGGTGPNGGTGADASGGMGGQTDPTGGSSGTEGGAGGADDGTTESCIYHSAPVPGAGAGMGGMGGMAGSGGSGGAAGASGDVTIRTSPFLGNYLADSAGRTLYYYGSDLPGDCANPPVSRCTADCLVTWPPFDAGARALAAGLDDAAFGTIQGNHGAPQTTYYGWPLYYYKDDTAPAQIAGQGKAKVWHVVEVKVPSVVIMREGTTRYLADAAGRTLYVSSADRVGNDDVDPESHCEGSCLMAFQRMNARNHSVVQSLEQDDFWSFVNPDGSLQLGYKGAPLYRSKSDRRAGDMTGTATAGFTAALP
jgi:predicted lipoprotein with Yx(FWY)xxD motif